jgi:hypothetical protein
MADGGDDGASVRCPSRAWRSHKVLRVWLPNLAAARRRPQVRVLWSIRLSVRSLSIWPRRQRHWHCGSQSWTGSVATHNSAPVARLTRSRLCVSCSAPEFLRDIRRARRLASGQRPNARSMCDRSMAESLSRQSGNHAELRLQNPVYE